MTTRYTDDNGCTHTSWAFETGQEMMAAFDVLSAVRHDLNQISTFILEREDLAISKLNADQYQPAELMIAVGPNGGAMEFNRALESFCQRHQVKHLYRIMLVG